MSPALNRDNNPETALALLSVVLLTGRRNEPVMGPANE